MLKEAKDTHGINSGGSPNDNMAADFSSNSSIPCNQLCFFVLCFVCEFNCSLICSSLVIKIARMIYICTTQLFCGLHLNNHIFYECINT